MNSSESKKCFVCQINAFKYNCPRCNIVYCSIECYRKHGTQCTESFYREQVLSTAKGLSERGSHEQRRLVAEMLLRNRDNMEMNEDLLEALKAEANGQIAIENSDFVDDEIENDNSDDAKAQQDFERFSKALEFISNGDVEAGLACLSDDQRKDFERSLYDGSLASLIETWTPWWITVPQPTPPIANICTNSLVEEVSPIITTTNEKMENSSKNNNNNNNDNNSNQLPILPKQIKPLSSIVKKTPSPLLAFNLLDILFAYVNTMRYYNGDMSSEPIASTLRAIHLSAVLSENAVHSSAYNALQNCVERAKQPRFDMDTKQPSNKQKEEEVVEEGKEQVSAPAISIDVNDSTTTTTPLLIDTNNTDEDDKNMSQTPFQVVVGAALHDIARVLCCKRFVSAAISDFLSHIDVALNTLPSLKNKTDPATFKEWRQSLTNVKRKLVYFQSWLLDVAPKKLALLHSMVESFIDQYLQQSNHIEQQNQQQQSSFSSSTTTSSSPPTSTTAVVQSLLFDSDSSKKTSNQPKNSSKKPLIQEL